MANIDFPNTPQVDDEFQADGKTYKWDGVKWVLLPLVSAQRTAIPTISFVDKTSESITVTFTNNEDEEVDVYYGLSTPPDEENIELNSQATSSNVVFDNLTQGTEYSIYAYAITKPTSKKIKSEIVELQVTTIAQTQPATLSFVSKNEISITLGVSNNDDEPLTSLTITGGEATFTESNVNIAPNTTQNFTIPNLIPNKTYNFIATVKTDIKIVSNNSNTITETATAQSMPTFSNVSSTSNSITFRVKNENSVPTTIRYSLGSDPTSGSLGVNLDAGITSSDLSFTGLAASTPYSIRARGDLNTNLGPVRSQSVSTQAPPPTWISATGGTTTTYSSGGQTFRSHTFTSSGNFVVNSLSNQSGGNAVDYLIIAGGAGGNNVRINHPWVGGGGGGAGGYRTTLGTSGGNSAAESKVTVTTTTYGVTVGAGGAGAGAQDQGNPGGSSSVFSRTSVGGGGGGRQSRAGANGASGGGGCTGMPGGLGTAGQGSNGGNSEHGLAGGGGGGAGQAGGVTSGAQFPGGNGGNGGNGLNNTLRTGSNEIRGGGGGGGSGNGGTFGTGGAGGGGRAGGANVGQLGVPGTANTGGGAGGNWDTTAIGQNGGSGIVIIRYRIG